MNEIIIKEVQTEPQMTEFIKFPWKIYKDDKNWVPPLLFDVKKNLDKKRNPFFEHSKVNFYLAYLDGVLSGRISAIKNDMHNEFYKDKVGFFGFFECINNQNVTNALFDEAKNYLISLGLNEIRGPINLSTNDEVGLLIDGFDTDPYILMPHNPRYYISLIEGYGFRKIKDLYAFLVREEITANENVMGKLERVSNIVIKKENIKVRDINLKDFDNELIRVREVYNKAWQNNWGFVPMTEKEFEYLADSLKTIIDTDLIYFAEVDGKPVGFSLGIPNMNVVFKGLNGKIFPFGIFKILFGKRKIKSLRLLIMGVISEYRKKGIEAVFIKHTIDRGIKKGYNAAEISWILEDNLPMVRTAENLGADKYKTYRIFNLEI